MRSERRRFLSMGGACALMLAVSGYRPVFAASMSGAQHAVNAQTADMLAAWQHGDGRHQVGIVRVDTAGKSTFSFRSVIDLPTRPHGLMHLQGDEYLVVARRPGDWMMRVNIRTGSTARIWQDADRHLNGHSVTGGDKVYTTETDLVQGGGAVGVRDRTTFELLDVWPTGGRDPHELLLLPAGVLGMPEPFLLVANGGIQTHPDMGRTPINSDRMDSSLVALQAYTGQVLARWALDDPLLSLRHIALHPHGVVGVAMQAQHHTAALRNAAPVLALLTDKGLGVVSESANVQGYAGDIVATPQGFAVSCTKQNKALCFDLEGQRIATQAARSACALAARDGLIWLGYQTDEQAGQPVLDNHWLLLG